MSDQPPVFKLGDIANGHVLTASGWVPVTPAPATPPKKGHGCLITFLVLVLAGGILTALGLGGSTPTDPTAITPTDTAVAPANTDPTPAADTDTLFLKALHSTTAHIPASDIPGTSDPDLIGAAKGMCMELDQGAKTPREVITTFLNASANGNQAEWAGAFIEDAALSYCPSWEPDLRSAVKNYANGG